MHTQLVQIGVRQSTTLTFAFTQPCHSVALLQAEWAKQHQPDDKIFVQALCEELKALELDPEKEDIWAPNNLLRKCVHSKAWW